jgi:3-deoxy-D-arabino-heptulosonate 7-phosphate (DAHP) synthase
MAEANFPQNRRENSSWISILQSKNKMKQLSIVTSTNTDKPATAEGWKGTMFRKLHNLGVNIKKCTGYPQTPNSYLTTD